MDAWPLTPGELVCLGSSLAFSGLFYYLYRRKAKVIAKIQEAPKLQVGSSLPSILTATGSGCLHYVAIEGVVQPADVALASPYHRELQGVIERLVLKEHRLIWNSLARSWTDSERVVLEQVHTVPFVLVSPGGKAAVQVSVESPLQAVELPLEMVYERFQQTSHGFKDLVSHYLSGEKPKGFLETEEMLLVGSSLTGIEQLLKPRGTISCPKEVESTHRWRLCGPSASEVQRRSQRQKLSCLEDVLSVGTKTRLRSRAAFPSGASCFASSVPPPGSRSPLRLVSTRWPKTDYY
ncbi:mitochondrial ubiquitin ligase activator of nfkb 1-A-like isoform X2 [Varanus komodoensis]|uniref:mitochondrial ubiquitin ligase activator of nfkb 1-A-like isoform X2 n=1 Tax=Varanus komodoensis TaxID=61221 RepID=UPI001CF7DF21|nr:mitochondrial ubiquitin ligase activator of nfkb 1-A-like isoform X2 [Varanus komodoensis]